MKIFSHAFCSILLLGVASAVAEELEQVSSVRGCPSIVHAPLVSVMRGSPAVITATVSCPTGEVVKVLLQVRLTDLGKPTPIPMVGEANGLYKATVSVTLLQGLPRFWYYIDASGTDAESEVATAQTKWHPVNIIDSSQGSEQSGSSLGKKALYWILGGAAVLGGAAIIEHNSDSGGDPGDDASSSAPPPGGSDGSRSSSQGNSTCELTGNEDAIISNTEVCFGSSDIDLFYCGICPDAVVTVVTSWGVVRQLKDAPPYPCPPINAVPIQLPKPDFFPEGPQSETINVFVNGTLIKQFKWPSASEYYICL